MKYKYTEYDENLRTQVMKTHDPKINPISLKAFMLLTTVDEELLGLLEIDSKEINLITNALDPLSTNLNAWVLFKDWEDKMKELGVNLHDERGIPIDDFNSYTHRFRAKYEDGISYIGYPELGDEDEDDD